MRVRPSSRHDGAALEGLATRAGWQASETPFWEVPAVVDVQVGLHVFLVVLIFGTLWRLLSMHAMASPNPAVQHAGKAMSIQY